MLQRYTLRAALLIFVVIPFVLLMLVGGLYSLQQLERQVEVRMQEDIELIARAIRLPLSHALERGRLGGIEQALASAFHLDQVYGVYVYDDRGQQIASSGTRKATVATQRAAELAAAGGQKSEFEETGGERIFSHFLPLTDSGGRINGLLQVTRRGSDFQNYIGQVRFDVLLTLTATGLLLAFIVFFGHNRAIGRHLRKMQTSMAGIDGGHNERRVPEQGPAELGELSRGINTMLDRISSSQQEIERQREREVELRLRLQESEKLAAIGRLAAGVAHELGSPLSTIDGKAQRLKRHEDLDPTVSESLDQVRREVRRMEQIVNQLMDFGRRNPLQKRSSRCDVLAHTVRDQIQPEIMAGAIKLELIGDCPGPEVRVDAMRLEQALGNLLRNALQVARERVRMNWYRDTSGGRESVVFTVEDDGDGINDQDLNHLFEPFYTTKPVGEGTGLGLAVAHAAISDHGGSIHVDTSPELGGARFSIVLESAATQTEHETGEEKNHGTESNP